MNNSAVFPIQYAGLPEGHHVYRFDVPLSFFHEYYEQNELLDAHITADVDVEKSPSLMQVELRCSGWVTVACDRCLDPCRFEVHTYNKLIFSSVPAQESEYASRTDVEYFEVSQQQEFISLDSHVYDFVMLSLPMRRVHDDFDLEKTQCNKEVIRYITIEKTHQSVDPRWAILEKFKQANSEN